MFVNMNKKNKTIFKKNRKHKNNNNNNNNDNNNNNNNNDSNNNNNNNNNVCIYIYMCFCLAICSSTPLTSQRSATLAKLSGGEPGSVAILPQITSLEECNIS